MKRLNTTNLSCKVDKGNLMWVGLNYKEPCGVVTHWINGITLYEGLKLAWFIVVIWWMKHTWFGIRTLIKKKKGKPKKRVQNN